MMKKLLVFFIILSFLVPAVFADVTVKATFNARLNVLQVEDDLGDDEDDGRKVWSSLTTLNSADGSPRNRIDITGSVAEGTAGFRVHMDIRSNGAANNSVTYGLGDWAFGWIKPFQNDLLLVEVGFFNQDTLRGKIGDSGAFHGLTHTGFGDPNELIFNRMRGRNGFALSSKPIDNLWVGFNVQALGNRDFTHDVRTGGNPDGAYTNTGAAFSKFRLAAGYTIPNIGVIRAQLLGADRDTHQNIFSSGSAPGTPAKNAIAGVSKTLFPAIPQGHLIQTAFNLTAVQGLVLDFGFGIPLAYDLGKETSIYVNNTSGIPTLVTMGGTAPNNSTLFSSAEGTFQAPLNLSLGAEYKTGDLGVWFRTDFFFAGYVQPDGEDDRLYYPVAWDLHVKPYYKIGDIGTVGLDFGFDAYGKADLPKWRTGGDEESLKGGVHTIGFGLWLQKSIAGGTLTTGLAYKVINKVDSFYGEFTPDSKGDQALSSDNMKELGVFSIPVVFELSF